MEVVMKKLLLCLFIGCIYADGVSSLAQFLQTRNNSISANFTQTVIGHKKNQISKGYMEISRPNKFRWQYDNQGSNIGQLIVSDGKTVYVVDRDLQQVTYKTLGQTLDKSPAVLLAGSSDIAKMYIVTNMPNINDIEWVELKPKISSDNNGFQVVKMGFNIKTHLIEQMQFEDNFGGRSQVSFRDVKVGVKFKPNEFTYVVPSSYDVIDSN
jgi:outer membrane lipoprotein carrier protein